MGFPFQEVNRNMILKFNHTHSSPIPLKMIYGNTYVLLLLLLFLKRFYNPEILVHL